MYATLFCLFDCIETKVYYVYCFVIRDHEWHLTKCPVSRVRPSGSVGYVQSLIRRVVNNVNIVVNNLILKYVEDDIVLSVNITSAECYTVDDLWERAFMDITGEQ